MSPYSRPRKEFATEFVRDKLSYHELGRDDTYSCKCYFDLIYNREMRFQNLAPVTTAWRSARTTTKNCDYVLAVMPDIKDYTVPQNARSYSFEILIVDALGQLTTVSLDVISKVPKGMIEDNKRWTVNQQDTAQRHRSVQYISGHAHRQ